MKPAPLVFSSILTLISGAALCGAAPQPGAPEFAPTAETPVGFRGDGSGRWPGATEPCLAWKEGLWDTSDQNILWRTAMPKTTLSSPIVVGDKVFTLAEPHTLLCVDAKTGAILWQAENDPVAAMPADIAGRARSLKSRADEVISKWRAVFREYHWLRGWPSTLWDASPGKIIPDALIDDSPLTTARLAELEKEWADWKFSQMPPVNGVSVPIYPAHAGHTSAIYSPGTPEADAFYGEVLRPLLLEFGISPLADATGLQPVEHGQTQQTPVSDGTRVYAAFGQGQTVCYDLNGKLVWRRWTPPVLRDSVVKTYGLPKSQPWPNHVGGLFSLYGPSPLLVGDTLITSHRGAIRGFDKLTGDERWSVPYVEYDAGSWGTPVLVKLSDGRQVLFCPQGLILDPKNGSVLAKPEANVWSFLNIPTGNWHALLTGHPVVAGDRVFATWAFGVVAYRLVPANDGKVELKQLWLTTQLAPDPEKFPGTKTGYDAYLRASYERDMKTRSKSPETLFTTSPVYDPLRNKIYLGMHLLRRVYAFDADTGALTNVFMTNNTQAVSSYGASATIVGGRYLYYPRASGGVTVFDLEKPEAPELAVNNLYNQIMRDWNSDTPEYPRDPAHKRAPWEIMWKRWVAPDWSKQFWGAWWPKQNAMQFYGDLAFAGDSVFIRSADALYCFKTGARDTTPPTAPSGLNAKLSPRQDRRVMQLRWEESVDNVRVAAYHVFVNGKAERRIAYPLAEFEAPSGTRLEFKVVAEDGSGNRSAESQVLRCIVP